MERQNELLVTFGHPISGTTTTCVWNSEAMRKVGLGARELQALCEQKGIEWRVYKGDTKISTIALDRLEGYIDRSVLG